MKEYLRIDENRFLVLPQFFFVIFFSSQKVNMQSSQKLTCVERKKKSVKGEGHGGSLKVNQLVSKKLDFLETQ